MFVFFTCTIHMSPHSYVGAIHWAMEKGDTSGTSISNATNNAGFGGFGGGGGGGGGEGGEGGALEIELEGVMKSLRRQNGFTGRDALVVLGERYGVDEEGFTLNELPMVHGEQRGAEVPEVARVVQLPLRMHYKHYRGVGRRVGRWGGGGEEGRRRGTTVRTVLTVVAVLTVVTVLMRGVMRGGRGVLGKGEQRGGR
jgi:hypothetical protein